MEWDLQRGAQKVLQLGVGDGELQKTGGIRGHGVGLEVKDKAVLRKVKILVLEFRGECVGAVAGEGILSGEGLQDAGPGGLRIGKEAAQRQPFSGGEVKLLGELVVGRVGRPGDGVGVIAAHHAHQVLGLQGEAVAGLLAEGEKLPAGGLGNGVVVGGVARQLAGSGHIGRPLGGIVAADFGPGGVLVGVFHIGKDIFNRHDQCAVLRGVIPLEGLLAPGEDLGGGRGGGRSGVLRRAGGRGRG